MPCWTATGTAARPIIDTRAKREGAGQPGTQLRRERQTAPQRTPGALGRVGCRRVRSAVAASVRHAARRSLTSLVDAYGVARPGRPPVAGRIDHLVHVRLLPLAFGLGLLVGGDQVGVARHGRQQLGVGAPGDHPAVLEVDHLVGQRDGGPPVGDHQDRRAGVAGRAAPARMAASTRGSTALVASSSTSSRGRPASARARVSRWRCPPESEVPRSPTAVSSPSGSAATKPSACGQPQRRPDVVVVDARPVEGDVGPDRVVEDERHLRHQRDGVGQRAGGQRPHVGAVEA